MKSKRKNARQRRPGGPLSRRLLNKMLDDLASRMIEPVAVSVAITTTLTQAGLNIEPRAIDAATTTVVLQAMYRLTGHLQAVSEFVQIIAERAHGRPV